MKPILTGNLTILSAVTALSLTSLPAFAETILTCNKQKDSKEITIVIDQDMYSQKMKIYQTFYGHTSTPQVYNVRQLPGSRGPVVAYGDSEQKRVLSVNFLSGNKNNSKSIGHYEDTTNGISLDLSCE